ncbi:hypothetical protein SDC9_124001 [bioreactor metagenome]|uniref:Uncharacterized protein n=1 Tax=bioreactor metagenome TaxID=1076179 RepID=A0A645CJR2_9ZZZZ
MIGVGAFFAFGARSVAFDQRHFRPIDRDHHARGVVVDFNWDAPHFIGLGEGVDDVELPQLFRRHLDQLGIGVVVGLPVPQERVANALVDCVDRGCIGHGAIVSEPGDALRPMTGNGNKQPLMNDPAYESRKINSARLHAPATAPPCYAP